MAANTHVLLRQVTPITKRMISTTSNNSKAITLEDIDTRPTCPFPVFKPRAMDDSFIPSRPVEVVVPDNLESETDSKIKPFSEIPGPKGYPVVGTLFDYFKKDGLRFNKMFEGYKKRAEDHGPIYREKIATICNVVISDPKEYAKVIRAEGKHPHRIEMEPMAHYRNTKGIGLGLVNSQGEEWYRHRTVLAKKMLRPKEVADYCDGMNVVGNDFIIRLNKIRNETLGEIPEMEREIFKWALESIGTVLFENRIGCFEENPSKDAQDFITNLLGFFKYMQPLMYNVPIYKLYPTKTWKMYEQYADTVMGIGQKFVNKKLDAMRRQAEMGIEGDDKEEKSAFLTYLLSQDTLTPEEVNAHMVDLLMGAVETTSNATIWTLYCLATHPEAQQKLYDELSEVLPNKGEVTAEKLAQMPYVKACLKEMFRIYPITFATSRITQEDIEVGGYNIPAGTHVQANLFGMGRDPNLFEDPLVFRPERWLQNSRSEHMAYSSLPWGHGARMCIGRRLAEQEIYIALTKIVQNFNLEYNHEPVEPVLNTVMTADRPVKISFIPRKN